MASNNKDSVNYNEIESNDVEVLKAKIVEQSKLLKLKDLQIEELRKENTILKSTSDIKVPNNSEIIIQTYPIDSISIWIQNPGLNHLSRQSFGYLDAKDLANCKLVSKTFNGFISNDKKLLIKQFYQFKNFKKIRINLKTQVKELKGKFEGDYIGKYPELSCSSHTQIGKKRRKKIWIEWFGLLETEDNLTLKELWKEMSSTWRGRPFINDARLVCIQQKLYNLFENLTKIFPIEKKDDRLIEALLEDSNLEGFSLILKHFEKCEVNIPHNFQFKLYYSYKDYGNLDNLKKMEILLEQYKINLGVRNDYGKTMLEIAILNDDTKVVELCEKFQKT